MFAETHTTEEYGHLDRRARLFYRFTRHPLICHIILPPFVFLALYRTPFDTPPTWKRERRSVYLTNLVLIAMFGALGWWLGFAKLAMIYLPIIGFGAIAGIWLFAVQHRFRGTAWYREVDWSPNIIALNGTSWLRLPKILQWFSGNIGLHHIHHFSPVIPNYRLQECLLANPVLQEGPSLSLRQALSASRYWLWDEERKRMVRFRDCVI